MGTGYLANQFCPHADRHSWRGLASALKLWSVGEIATFTNVPVELTRVLQWIRTDIVTPNELLGRPGAVCPFVPAVLSRGCLWMASVERSISKPQELCKIVSECLYLYDALEPDVGATGGLRTFIVLLPGLAPDMVSHLMMSAHRAMKPAVVARGLMLGEFFPGHQAPGIHNPKFRPLTSPIPLFVLRKMVPGDLAFLNDSCEPLSRRAHYLRSYLNAMSTRLSVETSEKVRTLLRGIVQALVREGKLQGP